MVQTDKAASTSHGHFNPPRPSSSSSSSSSPLSDLYKSSSNKLGQVRCRLKEEEKQEEEGGGGRKRQEKTGIGRDVANKRGKDKESFTNMTHERRFFNGWVVRLSSFEVSMLPFFFSPFLKYCIISNIFPQVSSYLRGGGWRVIFILTSYFSWTRFRKFFPCASHANVWQSRASRAPPTESRQQKNRDISLDKFPFPWPHHRDARTSLTVWRWMFMIYNLGTTTIIKQAWSNQRAIFTFS